MVLVNLIDVLRAFSGAALDDRSLKHTSTGVDAESQRSCVANDCCNKWKTSKKGLDYIERQVNTSVVKERIKCVSIVKV